MPVRVPDAASRRDLIAYLESLRRTDGRKAAAAAHRSGS
jgi:hypothetical protein